MAHKSDRARYKDVTEADWQQQIIDALHLNGWRVAHFRPAMVRGDRWVTPVQADGKGFPDIFAIHVKSGDMLAVELKREYESLTPEQQQWLVWFERAGVDGGCWKPSMVDACLDRIMRPNRQARETP